MSITKVLPLVLWVTSILVAAGASGQATSAPAYNTWNKVAQGKTGARTCGMLIQTGEKGKLMLVGGEANDKPINCVAYENGQWKELNLGTLPAKRGLHCWGAAAVDPKSRTLYAFSDDVLYACQIDQAKWSTLDDPALQGLSWQTLAADPGARKLVVVGSDKRTDNVGWTRTAVMDLDSGKWATLPVPDAPAAGAHKDMLTALDALSELVGRTRIAWFRDPQGAGTAAERDDLLKRLDAAEKLAALAAAKDRLAAAGDLVKSSKLLDALKALRGVQQNLDVQSQMQYPVPPSRRSSMIVFEPRTRQFILFGGDHEDYLLNDTWVLDLAKGWRRVKVDLAPSPRGGHTLLALGDGKVALHEGYFQPSEDWYGVRSWAPISPIQLWVLDVGNERWDLLSTRPTKGEPAPAGGLAGYASQYCSGPLIAADGQGGVLLETYDKTGNVTWTMKVDPAKPSDQRDALGVKPDSRQYRKGFFRADFFEVADAPADTGLTTLPANQWVRLPAPPRNAAYGCRQRDWGTWAWDADRDELLCWGGGHCVRAASTVLHYSPVANRQVEGYDADEPYSANGGGAYRSSVLNRAWCEVHGYHHWTYDSKAKLLVTGNGHLYDPARMDWVPRPEIALPYRYDWGHVTVDGTPHGAIAWAATRGNSDVGGLWRFDLEQGWIDLKPQGKLHVPWCDGDGITYDSKRNRLILTDAPKTRGSLLAYDFQTNELKPLHADNAELGKARIAREMQYVDHADWVILAEGLAVGEGKNARYYTRVYDCAANKWFLLDLGTGPTAGPSQSLGLVYDAKRKLVYTASFRGEVWALRLDPATAKPLTQPPATEPAGT